MPQPKKISLGASQVIIEWSDGHRALHSNKALREACPCALCAGEPAPIDSGRVIPLTPAVPEGVTAVKYSMVGRYAVSFSWSDGHSTGIYPYDYLRDICECESCSTRRASPTGASAGA